MGYTHWWQSHAFSDDQWRRIEGAARLVFANCEGAGIELGDYAGHGRPVIEEGRIEFNGAGADAGEGIALLQEGLCGFCKTERRPYDLAVVAVLAIAKCVDDRFDWGSDGWPDDLAPGEALGRQCLATFDWTRIDTAVGA